MTAQPTSTPVITIDGPTASGKGTVARAVAKSLGFHLLDSGAIYRAFALAVINEKIDPLKISNLADKAKALSLEFHGELVRLDGVDVTREIRAEAVGMMASTLSAIPEVRAAVLARQRAFAQAPGLVADGRDMGTVVFPDATLKIYLTATARTRAERRSGQLVIAAASTAESASASAIAGSFDTVIEKIRQRDTQDKSRSVSPLKPANDAVVIDNAHHEKEATIDAVLALWRLSVISA